jgi:hypothetical protein
LQPPGWRLHLNAVVEDAAIRVDLEAVGRPVRLDIQNLFADGVCQPVLTEMLL